MDASKEDIQKSLDEFVALMMGREVNVHDIFTAGYRAGHDAGYVEGRWDGGRDV